MKPKHPIQREIERAIRSQHKEQSTADAYWGWVRRYLDFCKSRGIGKSVKAEHAVTQFLSELANVHDVSANTQNQAFAALCGMFDKAARHSRIVGVLNERGLAVQSSLDGHGSIRTSIWDSELGDFVSARSMTRYCQPFSLPAFLGSWAI